MDSILNWISQYGYPGLFVLLVFGIVGLPIPDETLLVFSGYLISQGTLHPVLTWLTAFGGSVGGITLSYAIGRSVGYGFVHRYGRYVHFTEDRLKRIEEWFERIGHWLLTIGYYIPGVRHFTALVAGMSCMPYRAFAAFAYPGAALWVSTFLGLGYVLGDRWKTMFEVIHQYMMIALAIVAVVGFIIWYWRRNRSRQRA